jgi:NAD(P)-dependent dehydrogenase (short-subunit alcohol dehydrogenase family)
MKTAIVTGASSGIGRAIVKSLDAKGWKVIGLTRRDIDLSDPRKTAHAAEKLADKHLKIDALIHVAGIRHDGEKAMANRDLEDYDYKEISEAMNVGITSFMILSAALLPKLAKNGAVIGISGTFESGASGWLPYYTSKRALEDYLVGLAEDYPDGPRVYGVSPSDTATPAFEKFFPEDAAAAQPAEAVAEIVAGLALGDLPYKSGDMIRVKAGKHSAGFHS